MTSVAQVSFKFSLKSFFLRVSAGTAAPQVLERVRMQNGCDNTSRRGDDLQRAAGGAALGEGGLRRPLPPSGGMCPSQGWREAALRCVSRSIGGLEKWVSASLLVPFSPSLPLS